MMSPAGESVNRETTPPGTNYRTDYTKHNNRFMLLASETVARDNGKESLVIAAGGAFMSNFEVKIEMENASTLQYSNYNIALNLIKSVAPQPEITDIADVKSLPQGTRVTVEGIATSNVYSGDNATNTGFFDCIYVQDDTGGINLFPVSSGVEEGQKIRVTGTVSAYQGETQLAVMNLVVIDSELSSVTPATLSTKEAMAPENTGLLVTINGTVSDIYEADNVISQFTVTDESGTGALVYINAYITTAVDLSFIKAGARVNVTGLASIGENQSGSDYLPRIRVRDRNEITFAGPVPITSVKINADAIITIPRGVKYQFKVTLNEGALDDGIVWSVSSTAFATVTAGGLVTILNRTGTALLTATDPVSGISSSVMLRIV
jgi:3D (Asp-Asp-Asp) domain-containing protein